jgi:hypothetical protein
LKKAQWVKLGQLNHLVEMVEIKFELERGLDVEQKKTHNRQKNCEKGLNSIKC